jgi:hypothetical protein
MLGAAFDHPCRSGATDTAEPTGDQVGGFGFELRSELFMVNGRLLPPVH